jgi:uncharacterized glyoxalase superfamily protein PhnB
MAVIPMLAYENAAAAIDFLVEAFGFEEKERFTDDNGTVVHAELGVFNGTIMLATPSADYVNPKRMRDLSAEARKMYEVPYVIDGVLVEVTDLDAHFAHAKEAGATILSEPEDVPDFGVRHYRAEDPEGHRWMFSQDLPS